ncbi:MAG: formate dehydrogenase accessory sulfurtransferase FdhD [Desulfovibrionaceae bacterium]|nr:formate dehydrogenase accessory sulfurtransferase FdhD [Desulfovibrionaceae bacterium]MBF0514646.1 formate dehydrogenase accessory sulfurtransferase FdhD [Desulfovibrionaceae bacterium]
MADENPGAVAAFACRRFQHGCWRDIEDDVAPETALILHFPGLPPKRLWAYPEELDLLALGHAALDLCPAGQAPILTRAKDNAFWLEPAPAPERPEAPDFTLSAGAVMEAMAAFIAAPGRWEGTGCFHRAGLLHPASGTFARRAEDIGRHNCLDRLAGAAVREGDDLARYALFVSARMTASLTAKAARAGFRLIVSRSAVTTAGIDAALEAGVALAGFARENRFTVFADPAGRIV